MTICEATTGNRTVCCDTTETATGYKTECSIAEPRPVPTPPPGFGLTTGCHWVTPKMANPTFLDWKVACADKKPKSVVQFSESAGGTTVPMAKVFQGPASSPIDVTESLRCGDGGCSLGGHALARTDVAALLGVDLCNFSIFVVVALLVIIGLQVVGLVRPGKR